MTIASVPQGEFACPIAFEIIRPPAFARREEGGVTYITGRDYELAYRTVLRFADGAELPIAAKLFGDLNQQVVIRDARGRPARVSGYTQGRVAIGDAAGNLIFEGAYYDSRISQSLTGDDALTPTGTRIVEHWENGFGRGTFAGRAFSLGVQLRREGNVLGGATPMSGDGKGQID
ncbi:MAG TPA: hypothetical protein VGR91_04215 [Stellaceae bacterium]|nr:hypothetical protein [Stellaceae bacterium]